MHVFMDGRWVTPAEVRATFAATGLSPAWADLYLASAPFAREVPGDALAAPKVRQQTSFSCAPAALRAACRMFGIRVPSEREVMKLMGTTSRDGTPPVALVKVARRLGLEATSQENMTLASLRRHLDAGRPVLCAIQAWGQPGDYRRASSGHYVLAIGHDDRRVYFEDPAIQQNARGHLKLKLFLRRWHDRDATGRTWRRLGIVLNHPKAAKVAGPSRSVRVR